MCGIYGVFDPSALLPDFRWLVLSRRCREVVTA